MLLLGVVDENEDNNNIIILLLPMFATAVGAITASILSFWLATWQCYYKYYDNPGNGWLKLKSFSSLLLGVYNLTTAFAILLLLLQQREEVPENDYHLHLHLLLHQHQFCSSIVSCLFGVFCIGNSLTHWILAKQNRIMFELVPVLVIIAAITGVVNTGMIHIQAMMMVSYYYPFLPQVLLQQAILCGHTWIGIYTCYCVYKSRRNEVYNPTFYFYEV